MTAHSKSQYPRSIRRFRGFTLLELLVTVAIVAILAAIALPSYSTYVNRTRAKGAGSDLVAMSLALENDFQKTLVYPVYAAGTVVPALPANRTGSQINDFSTWAPAQGAYYAYSLSSTNAAYTVTATAQGNVACTLTLSSANVRTASGNNCGFTSW
jgi:type IV pilus assembly protein PilE